MRHVPCLAHTHVDMCPDTKLSRRPKGKIYPHTPVNLRRINWRLTWKGETEKITAGLLAVSLSGGVDWSGTTPP